MKEHCIKDVDHVNRSEFLVNSSGEKYFERLRDALSIRAQNVLSNNDLYYYDDFILFISSDNNNFVNLRNCGKKTVKELDELVSLLLGYLKDPASILNIPITKLGFSVRTIISLKAANIETLGELVSFSEDDILRFHGLGKNSIQEIKSVVNSKGLQIGMDINDFCQGITTNSLIRECVANREVQQNNIVSSLMIPIENLGLSVRSFNCLKAANIETLGELVSFDKEVILKFRNMGKKSIQEIENVVDAKGLWFGFDIKTINQGVDTRLQIIPNCETAKSSDTVKEHEQDEVVDTSVLSIPIEDLGLSVRAFNCLKMAEIETLGELVAFKKEALLRFRNLGKNSLFEIEEIVKSYGLQFGMRLRKYHKDKAIKRQTFERLISNTPILRNYSRNDLDYVVAFKEKYSHYPMLFLLYKSLNYLTEREQKVVENVWGMKSFSIQPDSKGLPLFEAWSLEPIVPKSIDEISVEFDLPQQRIHQLYQKANRRIKYGGSSVAQILKLEDWEKYGISKDNPFFYTSDFNMDYLVEERDFLIEYSQKNWNTEWVYQFMEDLPCISKNYLYFALHLKGLKAFWIDYNKKELSANYLSAELLTPDFYVDNRLKKYNYNRAIKEVLRLQKVKKTESIVIPISSCFIDNENYWNRIRPTKNEKENVLRLLIWLFQTLCDVQIDNDTIVVEANKVDYSAKIYEILKAAGVRLHRDEVFKRLKEACEEKDLRCKLSSPSHLTRFLTSDPRIISYGKSSYWGLKEWGEVAGSIREIAIEIVKKSEEPIRIQDITKCVLESRPDSNEKSVSSIIMQTTASGELLLFYGDYIGYPKRKYKDDYIIMPQSFDDWLQAFKDFVVKNKRLPYSNQNGYEGYLYRWHFKASQLTGLSSDEIVKFDMLEKELAHYPQNAIEYNFLHKCNLYKKFVESNKHMISQDDDTELYYWFYNTSRIYGTFKDNRFTYFGQLLQALSSILY